MFQAQKYRSICAKFAVSFSDCQLPVRLQQFQRRHFNAAIAQRLELQIFQAGRQSDSSAGFVRGQLRRRIESRVPQQFNQLRIAEPRRNLRNIRIAGIGDGISGVEFGDLHGMRAIHSHIAHSQRATANYFLFRVRFAGFEQRHQHERF